MKPAVLLSCLAAIAAVLPAQTTTKPATGATAVKHATTTSSAKSSVAANAAAAPAPWIKLPPGIPRTLHGPVKTALALHYEDIKVGTGSEGEAGKLWHIKYTGWRAADGIKFDSWDEHKMPVVGKDGKLELGPDGKPKMGDPQPMAFPQGMGRVIPGFDYALAGMRIGGKRRIFIPWQLAYGTRTIPDRPDHPGIPAKSDLIFDVELVEVTDIPEPPHPPMPVRPSPGVAPHPGAPGSAPGATAEPAHPSAPPAGETTPKPAAPPTTPAATQPTAPTTAPTSSTPQQPK
ncbi:MAG TPA: FKBP-type peptidyl-prolyl cis-trans isomerase [Terracidiphilus sp.]|nr:FKBP-type peptidyl-prolyl cis-trans isomerase [Terracidiphilus sp.]